LVFLLAGAAALLATLLSLGIREPSAKARGGARALEPSASAFALIADRRRAGAFVCVAAAGAAFGALFTYTQPFALSLGASKVSGFFVGYTLCALCVRLFLGSLADKVGRQRVAFAALVLYGLDACMTTELRPSLLVALGGGLGFAHGLLYPALNAIAAEGVPRARRGAVMSYFSACFYGGFALWVYPLGWLAKANGYALVFLSSGLLVWSSLWFLPKSEKGLVR
jgi:MFS family permease